MWPRVVTDGPHTMKPEVGPFCCGWMYSGRWRLQSQRCRCVRPSLAYRQNLLSSVKTTQCNSTLQPVMWVLLQALGSLVTQQMQHVPGCCLGGHYCLHNVSILMCSRPEPGLRVWECSTDHYLKLQHTTNTLCPTCAAIHRYVHPASRGPTMRFNVCSSTGVCTIRLETFSALII